MTKSWTTNAGPARLLPTARHVSGFSDGVAPEGTPQRLCPCSPVLSKNGGWPTTKSIAVLASPMQQRGKDQREAIGHDQTKVLSTSVPIFYKRLRTRDPYRDSGCCTLNE